MTSLDFVGAAFLGFILLGIMISIRMFSADSSVKFTSDVVTHENMNQFTESLAFDMNMVGFRDSTGQPVVTAKPDTLAYYADSDDNGVAEFIRYYLSPKSACAKTPNPDDAILIRARTYSLGGTNFADTQRTNIGLTKFLLSYFDSTGAATLNPLLVRGIKVDAKIESPQKHFDSTYSAVSWQSRFYPKNLIP